MTDEKLSKTVRDPLVKPDPGAPVFAGGLNESSGEFRIADKITFGIRDGNVLLRHSPTGEEVEISENELAGLIYDCFFVKHR